MGYWKVLEPYWEAIDIYSGPQVFLTSYRDAPTLVQTLFAAHFCESEVGNGGFLQFFKNPTGVLAPEAVDAYDHVGLPDVAGIVREAMDIFGQPYPRERERRLAFLETSHDKVRNVLDALDERFYLACSKGASEVYDGERLYYALDAFAKVPQ
jgi:hypothetical protein